MAWFKFAVDDNVNTMASSSSSTTRSSMSTAPMSNGGGNHNKVESNHDVENGDKSANGNSAGSTSTMVAGGSGGGGDDNNNNNNRKDDNDDHQYDHSFDSRGSHSKMAGRNSLAFVPSKQPADGGSSSSSTKKATLSPTVKFVLLTLMSLQAAAYVLMARYTRSVPPPPGQTMFDIHDVVLVSELMKFIVCCIVEGYTYKSSASASAQNTVLTKSLSSSSLTSSSNGSLMNYLFGNVVDWQRRDGLLGSLYRFIWSRPLDACKASVPACLYIVQQSLNYVALSNLSAPIYVAMIQGKVFATAVVSVVLLNRKYQVRQWMCLVTLTLGLIIVILNKQKSSSRRRLMSIGRGRGRSLLTSGIVVPGEEDPSSPSSSFTVVEEVAGIDGIDEIDVAQFDTIMMDADEDVDVDFEDYDENEPPDANFLLGSIAVIASCFSSAFAGVFMEKVMKRDAADLSLWMRNIQLSLFGIAIAYFQGVYDYRKQNHLAQEMAQDELDVSSTTTTTTKVGFLHGFTVAVWITAILQAGGGLLVAAIMKYADTVMKGLAVAVSVVLVSIASWFFMSSDEDVVTPTFVLGGGIILASVYYFSNPLPAVCNANTDNNTNGITGKDDMDVSSRSNLSNRSNSSRKLMDEEMKNLVVNVGNHDDTTNDDIDDDDLANDKNIPASLAPSRSIKVI